MADAMYILVMGIRINGSMSKRILPRASGRSLSSSSCCLAPWSSLCVIPCEKGSAASNDNKGVTVDSGCPVKRYRRSVLKNMACYYLYFPKNTDRDILGDMGEGRRLGDFILFVTFPQLMSNTHPPLPKTNCAMKCGERSCLSSRITPVYSVLKIWMNVGGLYT